MNQSNIGYSVSRWWIIWTLCQSLDRTGPSPYPCFSRKISKLSISNSEDSDGASCVRVCVPACGLPPAFLVPSLLGRLDWSHLRPPSPRGEVKPTTVHRLLKPRSPDDCPTCRLGSTPSLGREPAPAPVRPWREVKSRRGAPKRVNTDGFTCPNPRCLYFGITDVSIHALVGDGKQGQAERIQTFRCQACHTTFTARRNTPLYRLKTPSHAISSSPTSSWTSCAPVSAAPSRCCGSG